MARIAVIIDDICGGTWHQTKAALDLATNMTLALSVLPNGDETCRARTFENWPKSALRMMHIPMQPIGDANPGPNPIRVDDSEAVIRAKLDAARKAVPDAIGLNNHMGSAASADAAVMTRVLQWAAENKFFYVDSATTPFHACELVGADNQPRCRRNTLFLDNVQTHRAIAKQMEKARTLSIKRGGKTVIVIGHPHKETIEMLEVYAKRKRVEFVPLIVRVQPQPPVAPVAAEGVH